MFLFQKQPSPKATVAALYATRTILSYTTPGDTITEGACYKYGRCEKIKKHRGAESRLRISENYVKEGEHERENPAREDQFCLMVFFRFAAPPFHRLSIERHEEYTRRDDEHDGSHEIDR